MKGKYRICKCGQYYWAKHKTEKQCPNCYQKNVHPTAYPKIAVRVLVTKKDVGLE